MSRLAALICALSLFVLAAPAWAQDDANSANVTATAPAPATPPAEMQPYQLTFEEWKKLPERVRYAPGGDVPYGYEYKQMIKKAPMITGISILGGVYLASSLAGVVDPTLYPLLIPVVGPFITLATASQYIDVPGAWLLTWTGIAQVTGLGLFIWGLTDKVDWLVKKPYGFASLQVVPTVGPRYAGAVFSGRF